MTKKRSALCKFYLNEIAHLCVVYVVYMRKIYQIMNIFLKKHVSTVDDKLILRLWQHCQCDCFWSTLKETENQMFLPLKTVNFTIKNSKLINLTHKMNGMDFFFLVESFNFYKISNYIWTESRWIIGWMDGWMK